MGLTVVSVPIGNLGDITLRAIETLKSCDTIICEEFKPAKILMKKYDVPEKPLFQLNEHSRETDLQELLEICREKEVALISDCGTPGFCDPGAELVERCYLEKISVDVNPGASSLLALLAMSGVMVKEFLFVGFLPAEKTLRLKKLQELKNIRVPFIIMDTPYRLESTMRDLATNHGESFGILGVDLTGAGQKIYRDKLSKLASQTLGKWPFILWVQNGPRSPHKHKS